VSKTYRTPVVASLGNADMLTHAHTVRGKLTEIGNSTTTTNQMLDL
jgi:hypothetical protein